MKTLQKIVLLFCALIFFDARLLIYGQAVDAPASGNSHIERLSGILPNLQQIANEYRVGSYYEVKRIQRSLGLDDLFLIKIGLPQDCSQKTKCIYTLVRDKGDLVSFVTPCEPGESDLYHQHRANGDIVSAFEFICRDGSSFVVGISRSSTSVNSQLKR